MSDQIVPIPAKATAVVKLDSIEFNVIEGPPDDSQFVVQARFDLMERLEIDKIVADIDRSDDLLHIAACGVAGFSHPDTKKTLSDQVAGLQINLRNATGAMSNALSKFGASAEAVGNKLNDAFEELYGLHEQDAIDVLKQCEGVATEMTATAEGLEKQFTNVSDEAAEVLKNTLSTRDLNDEKRLEAEKQQRDAEARHARMQRLSTDLAEQIPKVEKQWAEAKEAQATADQRVFAIGITTAIFKGIGDGIGAAIAIKTAPMRAATEVGTALADSRANPLKPAPAPPAAELPKAAAYKAAQAGTKAAQAALTEAEEELATAQEEFDEAETEHTEAEEEHQDAVKKKSKDVAKKKKTLDAKKQILGIKQEALDDATEAKDTAEAAIKPAEDAEAVAKTDADEEAREVKANAVAGGVGAGLASAGTALGGTADGMAAIAANYAKEKGIYLDLLMKLQKEQRDALSEVAGLVKQIQNEGVNAQLAQAAVDSLQKAVGALREIVVIVQDLKLFWSQMALNCANLAKDDVRKKVELVMKRTVAERIAAYSDQKFQVRLLTLTAKWRALKLVAMEYKLETSKTHKKMGETFKQNPTIEEARKLAKTLSGDLGKRLKGELAELRTTERETKAALDELAPALAPAAA